MPSISEIKTQILDRVAQEEALSGLTSTSNVAIYNLWAYCVAFVIWFQYEFFDQFKSDMTVMIREQKQYSLLWFRVKAKEYRHGEDLPYDLDEYPTPVDDDTDLPVTRASVEELELQSRKHLFIKVATGDDELAPVSDQVKIGLEQYFGRIKPAGTKIIIFTDVADDLKLKLRFYYNPLLIDSVGARVDGTNDTPVQDAIRSFLKDLPFNSELRLSTLVDTLQNVEGCADAEVYIDEAGYKFGSMTAFEPITSNYRANSGYMVVADEDLDIEFIPKNVQI